jgi:hypothetical protein
LYTIRCGIFSTDFEAQELVTSFARSSKAVGVLDDGGATAGGGASTGGGVTATGGGVTATGGGATAGGGVYTGGSDMVCGVACDPLSLPQPDKIVMAIIATDFVLKLKISTPLHNMYKHRQLNIVYNKSQV